MPKSLHTCNLAFDLEIEKTTRKMKQIAKLQKHQTNPSTLLSSPPEITIPKGNPLWSEPDINLSSFLKAPPSSPFQNPFKTYSPPPSEKFESTEYFESHFDKSDMSDGEGQEKTLRQWAMQ